MKIVLDPGHGAGPAHNRGAVFSNEGDMNFRLAQYVAQALRQAGQEVLLTRKKISDNPSLQARGQMAQGADLFLSLHTNAGAPSVRGCEVYGDLNNNDPLLMRRLVDGLAAFIPTKNRGVRYRRRQDGKIFVQDQSPGGSNYYGVLYHNLAKVGLLLEVVFHTNREECRLYLDRQQEIGQEIARLILHHYGLAGTKKQAPVVLSYKGPAGWDQVQALAKDYQAPIYPYDFFTGTGGSWKVFKDQGMRIIALGGVPSNHTSYRDDFFPLD